MTAVRFAAQHTTAAGQQQRTASSAGHRVRCVVVSRTYVHGNRGMPHTAVREALRKGLSLLEPRWTACATRRFQAPGSLSTSACLQARLVAEHPCNKLHAPRKSSNPANQAKCVLASCYVCRNQMTPDDHHEGKDHDEEQENELTGQYHSGSTLAKQIDLPCARSHGGRDRRHEGGHGGGRGRQGEDTGCLHGLFIWVAVLTGD